MECTWPSSLPLWSAPEELLLGWRSGICCTNLVNAIIFAKMTDDEMHTRTHAHTHAHAHTHTHMHTHAHMHTHTHMHTGWPASYYILYSIGLYSGSLQRYMTCVHACAYCMFVCTSLIWYVCVWLHVLLTCDGGWSDLWSERVVGSLARQPLPSALLLLHNSSKAEGRGWRAKLQ